MSKLRFSASVGPIVGAVRSQPIWLLASLFVVLLAGCDQQMARQPRYDPLEESDFFRDGRASRVPPANTVPHTRRKRSGGENAAPGAVFRTGRESSGDTVGALATTFPREVGEVNLAMLNRGRERFNIYCTPCHGLAGHGDGMVVLRGFRKPPDLSLQRLRESPHGHFFDVITRGFGVMPKYAAQIEPADRWAIVAYIRALQLSQDARLDDLPASERKRLEELPQQ